MCPKNLGMINVEGLNLLQNLSLSPFFFTVKTFGIGLRWTSFFCFVFLPSCVQAAYKTSLQTCLKSDFFIFLFSYFFLKLLLFLFCNIRHISDISCVLMIPCLTHVQHASIECHKTHAMNTPNTPKNCPEDSNPQIIQSLHAQNYHFSLSLSLCLESSD